MRLWLVLSVLGLPWVQSIIFKQDSKSVFSAIGDDFLVELETSEPPDYCLIESPTGKTFCSSEAKLYLAAFQDCDQDPRIQIEASYEGCSFAIVELDSSEMGPWEIKAHSFGSVATSRIMVNQPAKMDIEMENAWGSMEVTEGARVSFICKVSVETKGDQTFQPPDMVWKLGEEILSVSSKYKKGNGGFTNEYGFIPTLKDSGKRVTCSVINGGTELSDSMGLTVTFFHELDDDRGSAEVLKADQPAVISRVIEAFPKPKEDDITWHFETPAGLMSLKPGESYRRLSASPIRDLGSNAYEVEFKISKVFPMDDGKTLNLDVQVGLATHTIDIPLKVPPPGTDRPPINPPRPEEIEESGPKEATAQPSADSMEDYEQPKEDKSESGVEPPEVQQASGNMNLIIIAAIIALLVLLCVVYYCVKWKRNKNKESNDEDDQESKPLTKEADNKENLESKPNTGVQFASPPTTEVKTLDETKLKSNDSAKVTENNNNNSDNGTKIVPQETTSKAQNDVPAIVVSPKEAENEPFKVENHGKRMVKDDTHKEIQALTDRLKPAHLELPVDDDNEYLTSRTPVASRENSIDQDSPPPARKSEGAGLQRQDAHLYPESPASTASARSMELLANPNPSHSPKPRELPDSKIPEAIQEIKRHVTSATETDADRLSMESPSCYGQVSSVGVQTPQLKVRDNKFYFDDQTSSRESLK